VSTPGRRILLAILWPGGLLALSPAALLLRPTWQPLVTPYLAPAFWLTCGAGILLCWRFNRSRLLSALCLLLLCERLLGLTGGRPQAGLILQATTLLLPLNLAFYLLFRETGLLRLGGLWRLLPLVIQVGGAVLLFHFYPSEIGGLLSWKGAFRLPLIEPLGWSAALGMLLSGLLHLLLLLRHPSAQFGGLLWGFVFACCGLLQAGGLTLQFWFCAASLSLLLASVETFHSLAYRDELTGLPGRRAMQEALQGLGSRYTIAMVDIDHFKKCNDRYGHDVGDQVLKMVAGQLARVGGGGRAYRYGGEEFAILFPRRSIDRVLEPLEQLRAHIAEEHFLLRRWPRPQQKPKTAKPKTTQSKQVTVTVSIGVSEPDTGQNPEEVFKLADKQLYKAKKGGRNRVCH